MNKVLIYIFIILSVSSCGNRKNKQDQGAGKLTIEIPEPPSVITDGHEILVYMAGHYWDNFDFSDKKYADSEVVEQTFSNYLAVLSAAPQDLGKEQMGRLMDRARADSLIYANFAELSEKYLYDPNSPFRNEELYIPVLENIVSWEGAEEIAKTRPRFQLKMVMKNRVGETAADFNFITARGENMSLHNIKSDYTLLYIANPGCHECAETTRQLSQSDIVNELLNTGKFKILAIYPDEDVAEWEKHKGDIPARWINARDYNLSIQKDDLYDLRAIPTLYLLDSDKKVLIKDAFDVRQIESYLFENAVEKY